MMNRGGMMPDGGGTKPNDIDGGSVDCGRLLSPY